MPLEPVAMKAGALGVLAFVLLVPTFNALNSSHFDAQEPPFKMRPPTVPPDFEPPPGEELPDEELDFPIPAGLAGCQNLGMRNRLVFTENLGATPMPDVGEQSDANVVDIGEGDVQLVLIVNFTSAYHGDLRVTVQDPEGDDWTEEVSNSFRGPQPARDLVWTYEADVSVGPWTVRWFERTLYGTLTLDANVVYLVCEDAPPAPPEDDA